MTRILMSIILGMFSLLVSAQLNVELISNVNYTAERGGGNDIWGYVAPDGSEYAVVGTVNGTLIYSLENPANPIERIFIPGASSVWRDMKHFGEYIYVTADAGDDGLLVIDMREAPSDIKYVYRKPQVVNGNGELVPFADCHNIHIDENGIIYLAGCESRGTDIFDPTIDPWDPPHIGAIESPYHHDNYVISDTLYASQISNGEVAMYDVSNKQSPILLGTAKTSGNFTHNAWADPSHQYLYTTDERAESNVDSYDISDPGNIVRLDKFKPPGTTGTGTVPHNTHYFNQYLVTSWYTEGVVITDVSQPDNMVMVAQFDTYDGPDGGFSGCWGTTPYLPSGYVLANDRQSGLFVLKVDYKKASRLEGMAVDSFSGQPIQYVEVKILDGDYDDVNRTDPKGEYKTGQVSEGMFKVEFYHPFYDEKIIEVNLTEGQTTIANVELVPSVKLKSYFKIIDAETKAPIPSTEIQIFNNGNVYNLTTDVFGLADTTLFNGIYDVYVGKWGYKNLEITAFDVVTENQYVIELERGYMDDFALDLGWTFEKISDDPEFKGTWERDVPSGTGTGKKYNPNVDVQGDIGNQCYLTGNWTMATYRSHIVKDGSTTLISPPMDLSQYVDPSLEFSLWMVVPLLGESNNTVEIFLTDGETEELIYAHDIGTNASEWSAPINLAVDPTIWNLNEEIRMKLVVEDDGNAEQLVEVGFDQFIVRGNKTELAPKENGTLTIFPNPAVDEIAINYDLENIKTVDIIDVTGRLVTRFEQGLDFKAVISTQNYVSGTYVARIFLESEEVIYAKFQVLK